MILDNLMPVFALIAAGAVGVFSNRALTLRDEWTRR